MEEIITSNAIIKKLSNGIVTLHHPPEYTISTLDNFHENYKALLSLVSGRKCPFLINTGNIVSVSRESQLFMKKVLPEFASAMAMIADNKSPLAVFATNMFLSIYKPAIPSKVFRKDEDGLQWLLSFL